MTISIVVADLCAITSLSAHLQSIAKERVDPNTVPQHAALLHELWRELLPGVRYPGIPSNQWGRLGFQGSDPCTDFRGGGALALRNLVCFSRRYPTIARAVVTRSHEEDTKWFGFALAGINLTFHALELLRSRKAESFFLRYGATEDSFLELYAVLFARLQMRWEHARPASVMEFSAQIKELLQEVEAEAEVDSLLHLTKAQLKLFD